MNSQNKGLESGKNANAHQKKLDSPEQQADTRIDDQGSTADDEIEPKPEEFNSTNPRLGVTDFPERHIV